MKRKKTRSPKAHRPPAPRLTLLGLWLVILLPPLVFSPTALENFRFPKLLLSECLGLASLIFLLWRLRAVERIDFRALLRYPALLATVPLLLVATVGLAATEHPVQVGQALRSLWIGVACLAGWSLAVTAEEHRRLLRGLIWPATLLSLMVILQFHELFNPFRFQGTMDARFGLTSLAGGAYDLAAYLVLPILIAQVGLHQARSARQRWGWGLGLGLCLYALMVTQTLTAIVACTAATLLVWARLLPWRRFAAIVALIAVVATGLVLGIRPLGRRLESKVAYLRSGNLNLVLTGRLDGWRAALRMWRRNPWLGVGHGAYVAEFGEAKLALRAERVPFYRYHRQPYFANAHSEFLEAAAEWGWTGIAALAWGLWQLGRQLRRKTLTATAASPADADSWAGPADTALMGAGLVSLGLLAAATFPFRVALVAYPYLLFLSWILRPREEGR
ncbi:MAG: O-antigen ligase family protein [bacterium]|nr:O-antigen ligase family protein [bacterium]